MQNSCSELQAAKASTVMELQQEHGGNKKHMNFNQGLQMFEHKAVGSWVQQVIV